MDTTTPRLYFLKNFLYTGGIDIDYDSISHCGYSEECIPCRCSTIENIRVNKIDLNALVLSIISNKADQKNEFLKYLVHRLLVIHKAYSRYAWDIGVTNGYYGQEIDYIHLNDREEIQKQADELLELSETNAIKKLLELEYGYLLPILEKVTEFELETIDTEYIIFGQTEHYKKLDKRAIESYKDYSLAGGVAICDKHGIYPRLIDGYHRCTSAKQLGKSNVKLFVGRI